MGEPRIKKGVSVIAPLPQHQNQSVSQTRGRNSKTEAEPGIGAWGWGKGSRSKSRSLFSGVGQPIKFSSGLDIGGPIQSFIFFARKVFLMTGRTSGAAEHCADCHMNHINTPLHFLRVTTAESGHRKQRFCHWARRSSFARVR